MAIHFQVDTERALVSGVLSGVVTADELIQAYADLIADAAHRPSYAVLADLTELTQFIGSSSALRIAAGRPQQAPDSRRAIIAPGDFQFGIARMYAVYAESNDRELRVFRNRADAEAWVAGRD